MSSDWISHLGQAFTSIGESLSKGSNEISRPNDDPKGILFDPFSYWTSGSYGGEFRQRPSSMSFDMLRQMSYIPLVSAILQVRTTQVGSFARPSAQENYAGFKIRMRDAKRSPSRAELKRIVEIENFMLQTGNYEERGVQLIRDDFGTFVKKIVRDSLVYDQCCFQVIPDARGIPAAFQAMSAHSMRLSRNSTEDGKPDYDQSKPFAVQVFEDQVIAEFLPEELCFGIRNPRTDLEVSGYGMSELEMLIHTLTSYLYAIQYNQKFFSQGMGVKGMLNFKGTIPERQLRAFKREFAAMVTGVSNAWRTPITNAENIQWIDLHSNNREMEYGQWLDFLIKVACSVYMIDPAEINFVYGNTGQSSAMGTVSSLEKVTESKDRGLIPLILRTFGWINRYIVEPIDPDFEIIPTGITSKTPEERRKQQEVESRFLKTVDELRAEEDLPPLPNKRGEIILNSTFLQWAQVQDANVSDDEGSAPPKVDESDPKEFDFQSFLSDDSKEQEDEPDPQKQIMDTGEDADV